MIHKIYFLLLCSIVLGLPLNAQKLEGFITNQQGQKIPYATIFIEELQTGTCANQSGKYTLSLPKGSYTISFRSLGYTQVKQKVEISKPYTELNIQLPLQAYILQGVTVRADNEDPAYSIMRKAIARTPGFMQQASSYTSEVYIKATIHVVKMPRFIQKRIELNGVNPKEGDVYVNESINKIHFKAPDKYEQEVISVNNTFPEGNEMPIMEFVSGSIYESIDNLFISPFAPNAFAHYRFEHDALLQDGSWFINKIKVIPKRKSRLLMEGYLYIVEDLWCLYSFDIKLNPIYTTLKVKQHYAPIKGNHFMPVSLFAEGNASAMKTEVNAVYTTTMKYSNVVINPDFSMDHIVQEAIVFDTTTVATESEEEKKVRDLDEKIEELTKKEDLSSREMHTLNKLLAKKTASISSNENSPLEVSSSYKVIKSPEAFNRDSLYWDSIRPIPAAEHEKISYQKHQEEIAEEENRSFFKKAVSTVFLGNQSWSRREKPYLHYRGLLSPENLSFTPVDGFRFENKFKLITNYKKFELRSHQKIGYAWASKKILLDTYFSFPYANLKRGELKIWAGSGTADIGGGNLDIQLNSIYNILSKKHYLRFYHQDYFRIRNRIDISNGLVSQTVISWRNATKQENISNWSLLLPDEQYDANTVNNQFAKDEHFQNNKQFNYNFSLIFTPKHRYRINNKGRKLMLDSKWPTFSIGYTGSAPLSKKYSHHHFINIGMSQKFEFYGISSFQYSVNAGAFLKQENIHFSQFKHFTTYQEEFSSRKFSYGYYLLNNYEYSTNKQYAAAHLLYSNSFLILKRLPGITKLMWNENLYLNMLYVSNKPLYYEVGYSIDKILANGAVGIFAGFKENKFHGFGVKFAFDF